MTWTSRQRIAAAFNHHEPDRTPIAETTLQPPTADAVLGHESIVKWQPRQWEVLRTAGRETLIQREARDTVRLCEILGFDLVSAGLTVGHDYETPMKVGDNQWQIGSKTYTHFPDTGVTHATPVPAAEHDPIAFKEKVEQFVPAPPVNGALDLVEAIRDELQRRELDIPMYANIHTLGVWDSTALLQTMVLEPEIGHRWFQLKADESLLIAKQLLDRGVSVFGVGGDVGSTRGPIISPEMYRDFIMPEVRRVTDFLHEHNAWAVNASDGHLWPIIDDFLIGTHVDGYKEIESRAGMDMIRLKAEYGDRICMLGNVDCSKLLTFGTPDDVKQATIECLDAGKGNGGHILMTSNCVHTGIPPENFLAMVQAHREYFGYTP